MEINLDKCTSIFKNASDSEYSSDNPLNNNCYRIICIQKGYATYIASDKSYTIRQGSYAILDNTAIYHIPHNTESVCIIFRPEFLDKRYADISTLYWLYNKIISNDGYTITNSDAVYHSFCIDTIAERIEFIIREFENKAFGYENCISGALHEIIISTIRNISLEALNKDIESIIKRIVFEISIHYNEDIRLSQFSREFGYSVSYLSECFKAFTGHSFSEYLKTTRMKAAHQLIGQHTDRNLEDIARDVGYTDMKYFVANYKKIIGITPSDDVKQLKKIKY